MLGVSDVRAQLRAAAPHGGLVVKQGFDWALGPLLILATLAAHLEVQAQLREHLQLQLQQLLVHRLALLGGAHHKHLHLGGGRRRGGKGAEGVTWWAGVSGLKFGV